METGGAEIGDTEGNSGDGALGRGWSLIRRQLRSHRLLRLRRGRLLRRREPSKHRRFLWHLSRHIRCIRREADFILTYELSFHHFLRSKQFGLDIEAATAWHFIRQIQRLVVAIDERLEFHRVCDRRFINVQDLTSFG